MALVMKWSSRRGECNGLNEEIGETERNAKQWLGAQFSGGGSGGKSAAPLMVSPLLAHIVGRRLVISPIDLPAAHARPASGPRVRVPGPMVGKAPPPVADLPIATRSAPVRPSIQFIDAPGRAGWCRRRRSRLAKHPLVSVDLSWAIRRAAPARTPARARSHKASRNCAPTLSE